MTYSKPNRKTKSNQGNQRKPAVTWVITYEMLTFVIA